MAFTQAKFIKGVVKADPILTNGFPQVAVIGRSNAGKSSLINMLTNNPKLAKTSSTPGRTQEINVFEINQKFYLIDLPGYGYSKAPEKMRHTIYNRINWYFFDSDYTPALIILIVDAKVGPSEEDLKMIELLEEINSNIVIVANKIDKIKSKDSVKTFRKLNEKLGNRKIIKTSVLKKIGIQDIIREINEAVTNSN